MHFANQVALIIFLVLLIAVAAGCSKPPLPKTSTGAGAPPAAQQNETAGQKLDKATGEIKRNGSVP